MKKDVFGQVRLETSGSGQVIIRDTAGSSRWLRWLARRLLAREATALAPLQDIDGVPQILRVERDRLERSWIDGVPMQTGCPRDPAYFRQASALLRRMHRAGVIHNDLAKEPNLLVRPDGQPAIIDFQLAWHSPARGKLFRLLGREDIRHLLKHKRTYCPARLTRREIDILENPALLSRIWMQTGKRLYLFVTRRLLGWADREGAGDRF